MPFGKVTNVLLLKNKNQAFLEFAEVHPAVTMVNFYNSASVQPTLGGRVVFIQHSQHKVSGQRTSLVKKDLDLGLITKQPFSLQ